LLLFVFRGCPHTNFHIFGLHEVLNVVFAGIDPPSLVVASPFLLEIYWKSPTTPNGIITTYRLFRSVNGLPASPWFTANGSVYSAVDATVQPQQQYQYLLQAATMAGATNSSAAVVIMPVSTPNHIPAPNNVTALSAYAIFVQWTAASANSTVDLYQVVLNAGTDGQSIQPADVSATSLTITGLTPYTLYYVRLRVCVSGVPNGCGMGPSAPGVYTLEAEPDEQLPPTLAAVGPTSVDVSWLPPLEPNGIIQQYLINRRSVPAHPGDKGLLVYLASGSVLHFTDYGADLAPFTLYEYRVTAINSQGGISSNWSSIRTLQDTPSGLQKPSVLVVGCCSVSVTWEAPTMPNGVISTYKLSYRIVSTVQNSVASVTVAGTVLNTSISGLLPYTNYAVQVTAVNSAGSASSDWSTFTTLSAVPSGIGVMKIQVRPDGQSVSLTWSAPARPNGAITSYAIYLNGSINPVYQGISLQYVLVNLQPYTSYSVRLESCTTAGCARSTSQQFMTSSIPPANQLAPSVGFVNATSVSLQWGPPSNSYGSLQSYAVYRTSSGVIQRRSISDPIMIFSTSDVGRASYSFTDSTVQPYTRY
jgi:usherin